MRGMTALHATHPGPPATPHRRSPRGTGAVYDLVLALGERRVMRALRAEVLAGASGRTVEIGAGTGLNAGRYPDAVTELVLTEPDAEMARRLRRRAGTRARVVEAEAAALPFPDASVDTVVSTLVLCTVPDPEAVVAELRRVLRPGGRLVAVTNGDEHVADLRREGGGSAVVTTFSSENGEASLRRHFDSVERRDVETRAVLPDREAALAYLRSSDEPVDWSLPEDGWPREYAGHVTVFVAS